MTPSWQTVFSALASERLRKAYASAVLGERAGIPPKDQAKLADAGLLLSDGSVNAGLFREILAAAARPKPQGVDRFFRDGRLEGLPASHADRTAVLGHLADRLFPPGRELDEPTVNLLIATVARDIPTLRRALVDYGYLERNADGTGYRRTEQGG